MSLPDFAALNERRAEAGLSTFMNPRNSAAGTIRQLDPQLAAERPLSMWCYGDRRHRGARARVALGGARVAARARLPRQRRRQAARHRGRGRRAVPGLAGAPRRAGLRDRRRRRQGRRLRAPAPARRRRPRPALGDRLEVPADDRGDAAATTIQWNVGKFGDLHPFAVLEPVHVGGVTVKLATLHNEEDLARKDVRAGDEVIVLRAGDVIPQVLSPAPHAVENPDRAPAAAAAGALPVLRHADRQGRGRLHPLPEPRLPGAPLAAAEVVRRRSWTSTASARSRSRAPGGRARAHGRATSTG